ncbi:MAG: trimethylamine corrinoid protein 2 [Anaerolineae bacterium]
MTLTSDNLIWKSDWPQAREQWARFWHREGMAIVLHPVRKQPVEPLPPPPPPTSLEQKWLDPGYRAARTEYEMATHAFPAEALPIFDTNIGPGSLGMILGAEVRLDEDTVWYYPCIGDPDSYGPIRFEPEGNLWFARHMALIEAGVQRAQGRYLVGIPDLIEGLDTLAALRGDMQLLYDLKERPEWVKERLAEINAAYFQVFDLMYERVRDAAGGNAFTAFRIWGPGKTAKLQCDFSANISPRMFRTFVSPYLAEQCAWLDYSLYHLDGTTALQHLEPLLEIEELDAIEWTPQAGRPGGGSPEWYGLYKRIRAAGKGVQAVGVALDEVIPLLDAVGPAGMCIVVGDASFDEAAAERLLKALEPYRR